MDQLNSEPDVELGSGVGGPVKHERPHLVPIGYILFFTPMFLVVEWVSSWLSPAQARMPFMTIWIPFVVVAGLWSLGLFITHERKRASEIPPAATESPEHAVLIRLLLSDEKLGTPDELERLQQLERQLEAAIDASGSGELDGNEIGQGEYVIFTYGPDADALFAAIEPLLRASALSKGGFVVKRYGPAGDESAKQARVDL